MSDDWQVVEKALGPRVPKKHASYLERVRNNTLDALARLREREAQLERDASYSRAQAKSAMARVAELEEALRKIAHPRNDARGPSAQSIARRALAHKEETWSDGDSIGYQWVDEKVTVWKREYGGEWRLATAEEIATAPAVLKEEE